MLTLQKTDKKQQQQQQNIVTNVEKSILTMDKSFLFFGQKEGHQLKVSSI